MSSFEDLIKSNREEINLSDLFSLLHKLQTRREQIQETSSRTSKAPLEDKKGRMIKFPTWNITEEWGKLSNKDRGLIVALTKNLGGRTVTEKLKEINKIVEYDESAGVPKILSGLVVLEMLSQIIKEYTESVGGFLFEGFLAGIFGGQSIQIVDVSADEAEGQTGKPITDVTLHGRDYSLKLLKPGTSIDGSFKNLVEHFATAQRGVTYLVVRKEAGDKLNFWEFDITKENFTDYIGYIGIGGMVPVQKWTTLDGSYIKAAKPLGEQGMFDIEVKGQRYRIAKVINNDGRTVGRNRYSSAVDGQKYKVAYYTGEEVEQIKKLSGAGKHIYGTGPEGIEKFKEIRELGRSGSFEEWVAALRKTPGYSPRPQKFHIAKEYVKTVATMVGSLNLEEQHLRKSASQYTNKLARDIIPIFDALEKFTKNFQYYSYGVGKRDIEATARESTRLEYALKAAKNAEEMFQHTTSLAEKMRTK